MGILDTIIEQNKQPLVIHPTVKLSRNQRKIKNKQRGELKQEWLNITRKNKFWRLFYMVLRERDEPFHKSEKERLKEQRFLEFISRKN